MPAPQIFSKHLDFFRGVFIFSRCAANSTHFRAPISSIFPLLKYCGQCCAGSVQYREELWMIFLAAWRVRRFELRFPLIAQFGRAPMHRANASRLGSLCVFLISTATATTTVFIPTLKQGTVALRRSSLVLAFHRRKSGNGIQREEV